MRNMNTHSRTSLEIFLLVLIPILCMSAPRALSQQSIDTSNSGSEINVNKYHSYFHTVQQEQQSKPAVCHCVIFRMDDVQDRWLEAAQLSTMNLFITKNQTLTLGVIMNSIGNDSKILGQISLGSEKRLFELALHGWDHIDYTRLNEQQQKASLVLANEKMKRLFGNGSDIFITPYGTFNNSTLNAMGQLGIRVLSAALFSESSFDRNGSIFNLNNYKTNTKNNNIYNNSQPISSIVDHIPGMVFFKNDEHNKKAIKIPIKNILSDVDNTIRKFGYSVIVFHPQDFVSTDQNGRVVSSGLNVSELKDLSQLIDQILSRGIRIVSFANLISYGQPTPSNKALSSKNITKPNDVQMFSSLDASETQQWTSHQSSTMIKFAYFPAVPMIGNVTTLKFNVEDAKTGVGLKNLTAWVSILGQGGNVVSSSSNTDNSRTGSGSPSNSLGSTMYKLKSLNGDFSLNYKFLNGGMYQAIVRVNSNEFPIALASFDIYVI
jgi:peptidoglycan/xylan/chitin deacetylase (PgdA/CDA1 family)